MIWANTTFTWNNAQFCIGTELSHSRTMDSILIHTQRVRHHLHTIIWIRSNEECNRSYIIHQPFHSTSHMSRSNDRYESDEWDWKKIRESSTRQNAMMMMMMMTFTYEYIFELDMRRDSNTASYLSTNPIIPFTSLSIHSRICDMLPHICVRWVDSW